MNGVAVDTRAIDLSLHDVLMETPPKKRVPVLVRTALLLSWNDPCTEEEALPGIVRTAIGVFRENGRTPEVRDRVAGIIRQQLISAATG